MPKRVLLAILVCCRASFAQTPPTVGEILTSISMLYKGATQYELICDVQKQGAPMRLRITFKSANNFRMEGPAELIIPDPDVPPDELVTMVYNGSELWVHFAHANAYVHQRITSNNIRGSDLSQFGEYGDQVFMWRYRSASDFAATAKFEGSDAIKVSASTIDCYVITVYPNGRVPYKWWVDKKSYRILREDDLGNSVTFTTIRLNEPLAEDLFKFEAPPGAREVVP